MARLIVTIDGPAGSGKSSVARLVAQKLDAAFLDTGAMYRAVTLSVMISPHPCGGGHEGRSNLFSERQILDTLDKTAFEFSSSPKGMLVRINGIDVTEKIRDPEVTANAHFVASCAPARARLVEMQRQFAQAHTFVVTEGRDQGTVAFPDALVKFYVTASLDERAKRRQAEQKAGAGGGGIDQSIDQVRQDILKRDQSDQNRSVGPLKPAPDALIIDTTNLTLDQVVDKLVNIVKEKCSCL